MGKIALLSGLIGTRLPESVLRVLYAGRRETLGARILDPKAQAVGQFSRLVRVPGYIPTPEESREQTRKITGLFDEPCPVLVRKEDLTVPCGDGDLPARLYCDRAKSEGPVPVLVFVHGGGWLQGDLETHDGMCGKLAKWSGCMVIAVEYRLAPENKFPAAVEDAVAAYKWVRANAASIGADPERVGVGGDSAGGNLSAVVRQQTALSGDRTPDLQVLTYPALDGRMDTQSMRELRDAYIIPRDRMEFYRDCYIRDAKDVKDVRFSPALADDLSDQPKACIVSAGFDPLRDEAIEYARHLEVDGVLVKQIQFPGQIHGFASLCKVIPQGNHCIRAVADWLSTAW